MTAPQPERIGTADASSKRSVAVARTGQAFLVIPGLLIFATWFLALQNRSELSNELFLVGVLMAVPIAGLIITRQPTNIVGWLIAAFVFSFALGEFSHQYVIYGAFRNPGVLPAVRLMAIPVYFVWYPGLVCVLVLLPLYFPNGQLVSPAWRPVSRLAGIALVLGAVVAALTPSAGEIPGYPNPIGLPTLIAPPALVATLFDIILLSWVFLGVLGAVSLIIRYRRAGLVERQQLKWFILAVLAMLLIAPVQFVLETLKAPNIVGDMLAAVLLSAIWIAIGIAILRYRLFDIDIIIRKTLTYAIAAALLAAVYFGSVILLQQIFASVTGQRNEVVTVLSTLAIAALFVPLRNRIQAVRNVSIGLRQLFQEFSVARRPAALVAVG